MTSYSQRPTLIPHFSCPHTLSIALETAPLKMKQQMKKTWCFLPWLVASSWQNKSLDQENKTLSVLILYRTKGDSWLAVCIGGFRRTPVSCVLHPELLAAACEAGLKQSQGTGWCWHCFLVATVKKTFNLYASPSMYCKFSWPPSRQHLIYMPRHPCTASSLGPRQDSGRESQVMSLGLTHPWLTFKLSACLGVDYIHL